MFSLNASDYLMGLVATTGRFGSATARRLGGTATRRFTRVAAARMAAAVTVVAALVAERLQPVQQAFAAAAVTAAARIAAACFAATARLSGTTAGRFFNTARRFGGTTARRLGRTATRRLAGVATTTTMVAHAQHPVEQFKSVGVCTGEEKQASSNHARHCKTRCHGRTP